MRYRGLQESSSPVRGEARVPAGVLTEWGLTSMRSGDAESAEVRSFRPSLVAASCRTIFGGRAPRGADGAETKRDPLALVKTCIVKG